MATELGLLYLTHLQKLAESDQHRHRTTFLNPSSTAGPWMWNPKQAVQFQDDDDDSWEVRAFAEDTNHAMGTTWPPRSYTCTFCRREFRSAQALGGHMNVHRRDRARLHQTPPSSSNSTGTAAASSSAASSSSLLIPTQEFVNGGGLCLMYSLPNPNGVFTATATTMNACMDSPSSHLRSISPYPPHTLISPFSTSINFPVPSPTINSSICQYSTNTEPSTTAEVLDLELRLGRSSSRS